MEQHVFLWDKAKTKTLEQTLSFYITTGHIIVTVIPTYYEKVEQNYQQIAAAIIVTSTTQKVAQHVHP